MDSVIDYINQVKKTVDDMYSDIFNTSGEEMLKNGGCYEFVKIMQNKFVGSKMYLRFDSNHCAVLIDDILYDVEGVVKNKEDYHEANQKEIDYMEVNAGRDYKVLHISENFLNYKNKKGKSR